MMEMVFLFMKGKAESDMGISNRIKQLFCKHSFEKHYIPHGFRIEDGWMVRAYDYRCSKCGKRKFTKIKGE